MRIWSKCLGLTVAIFLVHGVESYYCVVKSIIGRIRTSVILRGFEYHPPHSGYRKPKSLNTAD